MAGFRKVRNRDNNWLIDRKAQKTETYSGVEGVNTQDHAVQESMGPIVDRTDEHLCSSDKCIFAVRRLLSQAATMVQQGGDPPGLKPSYYSVRPTIKLLPDGTPWREAVKGDIRVEDS